MPAFLCIASYFKGNSFYQACKQAGNEVYLVTSSRWKEKPWAFDYIDEIFYMDLDDEGNWNMDDLINGTAYLLRNKKIDRIIAIDDFDVEKAAELREVFRFDGMTYTVAKYFRDKLAMRLMAAKVNLRVPAFAAIFNDKRLQDFLSAHPAPWFIKARGEASTTGIYKCENEKQVNAFIHAHPASRYKYLIESYIPGDVYHVDSFSVNGKIVFSQVSQYFNPPFDITHSAGIFRSASLPYDAVDTKELEKFNSKILTAFGIKNGPAHTEYIKSSADGKFYFLETSSRLAGAFIPEMVLAASGINLWTEWAKLETCLCNGNSYKIPKRKFNYSGIITSLSRFSIQDYSDFKAEENEIFQLIEHPHHVGLIIQSNKLSRIQELIQLFSEVIIDKYHASAEPLEKRIN